MFRIEWLLVGFLLILGELGVKGKDFLLNGIANLHDFHVRSLVLGFGSWGGDVSGQISDVSPQISALALRRFSAAEYLGANS
jgi:hypothetical protein